MGVDHGPCCPDNLPKVELTGRCHLVQVRENALVYLATVFKMSKASEEPGALPVGRSTVLCSRNRFCSNRFCVRDMDEGYFS